MNNNNSKNILLSVLGVAILVVAVVGVSFAVFQFAATGTTENTLSTAEISMTFKEKTTGISITNAMPTSDTNGSTTMDEGEYFDFSVSATLIGTTTIDYEIAAIKGSSSTLADEDVRLYLEESTNGTTYTVADGFTVNTGKAFVGSDTEMITASANAMQLVKDSFTVADAEDAETTTRHYRLRMWVAEDADLSGAEGTTSSENSANGEHTVTGGTAGYTYSVTVLLNAEQQAQ